MGDVPTNQEVQTNRENRDLFTTVGHSLMWKIEYVLFWLNGIAIVKMGENNTGS